MTNIVLQPMKWSELSNIESVEPLNDKDACVLEELRDVLVRRGYSNRFGICLLHKHFDLNDDEYILESTDEENRTQNLVVVQGGNPDENAIQTMWKFEPRGLREITKCILRCKYFLGHKRQHVKEAG